MGIAEDFDDIGGDFAAADEAERYAAEIQYDRERRLYELKGRYVITCIGQKSKRRCYLQDRNLNKGGWWTQYLPNALGYYKEAMAKQKANALRYNKCTVMPVTDDMIRDYLSEQDEKWLEEHINEQHERFHQIITEYD